MEYCLYDERKGWRNCTFTNYILDKTILTEEKEKNILASLRAVEAVDTNNSKEKHELIQKISSLFGNSYTDWIEIDFSSWNEL